MSDHAPPRWIPPAAERLAYARAELGRPSPAGGGLTGFLVDPERAEVAVRQLDAAILDIRQSVSVFRHRFNEPPTMDTVGQNLARQMTEMDRRAVTYVRTWADQVQAFRDEVQRQIDAHRRMDAQNAERLA